MKKLLLILGLVAVVLVAGCTGSTGDLVSAGAHDCGSDEACFTEKAKNCEPAFMVLEETSAASSMRVRYEIQGGTVDECTFYMKIEDLTFSDDLPEDQRQYFEEIMGSWKGKDMTCKVSASQIESDTQTSDPDACTGSLIDEMENMGL